MCKEDLILCAWRLSSFVEEFAGRIYFILVCCRSNSITLAVNNSSKACLCTASLWAAFSAGKPMRAINSSKCKRISSSVTVTFSSFIMAPNTKLVKTRFWPLGIFLSLTFRSRQIFLLHQRNGHFVENKYFNWSKRIFVHVPPLIRASQQRHFFTIASTISFCLIASLFISNSSFKFVANLSFNFSRESIANFCARDRLYWVEFFLLIRES